MFSAQRISADARPMLVSLFDYFRNEQDHGRIPDSLMNDVFCPIIERVDLQSRDRMISETAMDPAYPNLNDASLRKALNKVAHPDPRNSKFRIDGDRHILVLSGPEQNRERGYWVIEVDVQRLCDACANVLDRAC